MRHAPSSILSFLLAGASAACTPTLPDTKVPAPVTQVLPLHALRLYETGVGYFERIGSLGGSAAASLPVPAGHLDDALASLVVLNGGAGGLVSGLSFASSVTKATARSSAGLPADPGAPIRFEDLLTSLKGAAVTIHRADPLEPLEGRVVEVAMEVDEASARALAEIKEAKHEEPRRLVVTLLTPHGELTRVAAEAIVRIRPTDPVFAARLDAALDALGTRSSQNARSLRLLGDARGEVSFGYIAETPIWRASYRLIEGARAETGSTTAVLQGWALIHNDTDENWHDVHLELVNGEPDSFVFPMAAPRYARRALVHPDEPLSTIPQLADTTADTLWGDNLDVAASSYGMGSGYGSGHGRLGGSHTSSAPSVRMGSMTTDGQATRSGLVTVGNLADLVPASGAEQGAFFVYAVPAGLSLAAHASGLVPFVQRSAAIERLAFFAGPEASARSAVRFVNGTGQTLPAGTLSVFGDGGFLGETTLDRLKPGERRFLQVGNDLDAELAVKKSQVREETKRLSFEGDQLAEHFLRTTESTWELENRAGTTRTFYVSLQANSNATVTGADRVDFDEATSTPGVMFDVKAKQKATRVVVVLEGLSRATALDSLTAKRVRSLSSRTTVPAAETATLLRALPQVQALEGALAAVLGADRATELAQRDLERFREDVKAVGGNAGAVAAPLVKRMVEAEDQVASARKNKEAAAKTLDERRDQLREALVKLTPAKAG